MKEFEYSYPDTDDKLVFERIQQIEPYTDYWGLSEYRAFKKVFEKITKGGSLLYVGAGKGRLFPFISQYGDEIIAYEPDQSRFNLAKENLLRENINNVSLWNKPFSSSHQNIEQFDTIYCGYVIQHIGTETTKDLFQKLLAALKPGGNLILATNFSHFKEDYFTFLARRTNNRNEHVVEEPRILLDDYEKLVNEQRKYCLPIRYFSIKSLETLLNDFDIRFTYTFHDTHKNNLLDKLVFRDEIINKTFLKRYFGRHIILLATKR